jgi:hypothetical protein
MQCNTSLTHLPICPSLPRGLGFILILSLLLHVCPFIPTQPIHLIPLPALTFVAARCHRCRPHGYAPRYLMFHRPSWDVLRKIGTRLLARCALLILLLHMSGWLTLIPGTKIILLIPLLHAGLTLRFPLQATQRLSPLATWSLRLQRLYQLMVGLLLVSTGLRLLGYLQNPATGIFLPMALGVSAISPDDEAEIHIDTLDKDRYHIIVRGTFHFFWEPCDGFEKWMLILFLRRFLRVGETRAFVRQHHLAEAFGVAPATISAKTKEVEQYGWHILSDRYRHQIYSALPDAELSRDILKIWVPAFWLSAWDVRERLIQAGLVSDRAALPVESILELAHHTGFAQVRDQLIERFTAQDGHLIAKETWWVRELVALNERLIAKLERGERLTSQERVEIEPLRLKPSEKQDHSERSSCSFTATLKNVLFAPSSDPSLPTQVTERICCTYCGSNQVAPKSKQPRRKTVLDESGATHVVEVLRYYCKNPDCSHQTFTHFPSGILPHARYTLQMRLVAVEVYETLLTTYRRSARLFGVKAVTVYHWVASLSPAAMCLAAYLGVVRTSGVVGIDDKWILVCSPSAVRPHGRRSRAVWRYAYFAIDVYSYDLLALELYPDHNDEAVRLILLELKAKGMRPRVVVSDLDPAYGRILPQVFPNAVHHECIFHALQFWSSQMTKVYGRYYLEKVPEVAPLHDALTNLFNAQTQKTVRKRFAELMALRETYVTKTPAIESVFDSVERHFPKLVNAIESADIPRTNNATELVIRRFDQHYQAMCGLDTLESAENYLRVFELAYRLTPFTDDARPEIRGKSPLELAGYDLKALPIANFFTNLKLPALALQGAEVVPIK